MDDEMPHFWCRNEEGSISRPGKRRIINSVSRSDIRVSASLANAELVQDCRGKSLYDICLYVLVRHVNDISWDNVPQHIAADLLHFAHSAGTIADATVVRISQSDVHKNFVTGLDLSRSKQMCLTRDCIQGLATLSETLTMLDMSNRIIVGNCSWILRALVRLTKLKWLNLSNTNLEDDCVKKIVYPTKYSNKGLTQLRYLDLSENPLLTQYAETLSRSFPLLQTLVMLPKDQRYFILPAHNLQNWGHDIVIQWLTGDLPFSARDNTTGTFYDPDSKERHKKPVYKKFVEKSQAMHTASRDRLQHLKMNSDDTENVNGFLNREKLPVNVIKTDFEQSKTHNIIKKRPIKLISDHSGAVIKKRKRVPLLCDSSQELPGTEVDNVLSCYSSDRKAEITGSLFDQLDSGLSNFYN